MVISILLASIFLFSCELVNGIIDSVLINADEVESRKLDDFTGNTPAAGDDEAIVDGFVDGLDLIYYVNPLSRALDDDYEKLMVILMSVIPGFADAEVASTVYESVSVDISGETIASDYQVGDSRDPGTVTITKIDIEAEEETDSISNPTSSAAEINLDIEIANSDIIRYVPDFETGIVSDSERIEEAALNMVLKANATADLSTKDGETVASSVDLYFGCGASLGFSYSNEADETSGKYIVNVNFIGSGNLYESDFDELEEGDLSSLEDLFNGLNVIIQLYDNDNKLVDEVDLIEYYEDQGVIETSR